MIAVDTSAVLAIALREPDWEDCFMRINRERDIVISAVNLAEVMVVGAYRRVQATMPAFLETLKMKVIPVDEATAHRVAEIYQRWGKGIHPAALNYCDCFSYDVARQFGY